MKSCPASATPGWPGERPGRIFFSRRLVGLSWAGFFFGRAGWPRSRAGFFFAAGPPLLPFSGPKWQGNTRFYKGFERFGCAGVLNPDPNVKQMVGFYKGLERFWGSKVVIFGLAVAGERPGRILFRPGPNKSPARRGPGPAGPPRGRAGFLSRRLVGLSVTGFLLAVLAGPGAGQDFFRGWTSILCRFPTQMARKCKVL